MITFKQFLSEELAHGHIHPDDLDVWIEQHAPKYAENVKAGLSTLIWRGDSDMPIKPWVADTSKTLRKSANTANLYTLWFSNHPTWAQYPPRQSAIICSTELSTASAYGKRFVIIPADNAKIGICPENDLWFSFNEVVVDLGDNLGMIISAIKTFLATLGLPFDTYEELEQSLKAATLTELQKVNDKDSLRVWREISEALIRFMQRRNFDNLHQLFTYEFDPKRNGFSVATGATIKNPIDKEIWITGNILAIPLNMFQDSESELITQMRIGSGEYNA